ncbi:MAG: PadR family transcriptional regulator [Chloroflexota bacterium]
MTDIQTTTDPGLLLLISLASGAKHGHAMLLDVERFAGVRLGPGTLYGALSRLETTGQVEALPAEGRRRPYRLTGAGKIALEQRLAGLSRAVSTGIARVSA